MGVFKKILISMFIALHVTVMVTAGLPDKSAVGKRILKSIAWYQIFFGLDQTWSMFAPNPSAVNSYLDATITFKDGTTEKWTFPRSSHMSSWDRFTSGERMRKYQQENLRPLERQDLWFDLSRFLEREITKLEQQGGRGRILESVQFFRHHNIVKPPTEVFIEHGKPSSNYQTESVFKYQAADGVRHEAKNNN
ncbi:hypothetical protein ACES2L_12040 [Bdellovibrio bacteriovorus]